MNGHQDLHVSLLLVQLNGNKIFHKTTELNQKKLQGKPNPTGLNFF